MRQPFVINPALTAIALGYGNEKFIADAVLPRTPVGKQEFAYQKYALADSFTIPNTRVGRKGKPGEVEFSADRATAQTDDYGLELPIPYNDIELAAGTPVDPMGRGTELLSELVGLDREKRVADMVFNAANYAAANKTQLGVGGLKQFSDTTSDPLGTVLAALDTMVMRPNVAVIGRAVYTKLATHPSIVKAYNRDAGDTGKVPLQFLADLMEMDEIMVGEGWYNSAKPGKTATMVRLWGKHMALFVRNKNVSTIGGVSFGYTAEWGTRVAGNWDDKDIGLRGGVRVRVGESVKELLIANDLGYFIQDAVA